MLPPPATDLLGAIGACAQAPWIPCPRLHVQENGADASYALLPQ